MQVSDQHLRTLSREASEWDSEITPYFAQPEQRYRQSDFILQLLLSAGKALDSAVSYRNFPVAASAIALASDGRVGRFTGYNVKVDPSDAVNIHAEDLVREKSRLRRYVKIPALAIVGQPQPDKQSGKLSETLHPCGRCRDRMSTDPLFDEQTLIVTATPDFTTIQFGSLDNYTDSQLPGVSALRTVHFGKTLSQFKPLPIPGTRITLNENDVSQADEAIWFKEITVPLLNRS